MYVVFDISGANELKNIVPTAYSYIEYADLLLEAKESTDIMELGYKWHELYESNDVALGKLTSSQPLTGNTNKLYVPLRFWFNNNPG